MEKMVLDFVNEHDMCLLTDFYEFTMCAAYFEENRTEIANFELFIRRLPSNRSYFVFAGLEEILKFLKKARFNTRQIRYLRTQGLKPDFLNYLRDFRFSGDVWSVPEGTIVFPDEPLIRVTAPIIEAQLIETFILNTVNLQTTLATKASRVVNAARGKPVIEFGLRRTQGADAGMKAARCSYIAGCDGTSNVLAGMRYGIPVFGTMAHSYVMFFDDEIDSFRAYVKTFPKNSTLLIDTYDDLKGARNAAMVAKELETQGERLRAVRLDSGDLSALSHMVRKTLDNSKLAYVKIFGSGDLDEYKVDHLLRKGAKIDSFGVGTRMSTSSDRPYIDVVYKLSARENDKGILVPAMKLSKGKITLPGRKQIFRQSDNGGSYVKDVIGIDDERTEGEPLLTKVMGKGEIEYTFPRLDDVRSKCLENLSKLPRKYKKLKDAPRYPVILSPELKEIKERLAHELRRKPA